MAHKTVYNKTTSIIETKAFGEINFDELVEIISEKTSLANIHNCLHWLTDFYNAQITVSNIQEYQLSCLLEKAAYKISVLPCTIKRAIIINQDYKKNFMFAKTVTANRGIIFEIFNSSDDAVSWLNKNH